MLILAYVATGKLGLMLALPPGYASAIFPPAGIAVAAVFVLGRSALPSVFLGSFILNTWIGSTHQPITITSLELALLIAGASTLQAWVGGWWLKNKIGYPTTLDNPVDVVNFFVSAPIICLISATVSVAGLFALGLITQSLIFTSWASWWIGDSLGLIVMLPLFLVAVGRPRDVWKKRLYTIAVPMAITFALLVIIFVMVSRWERKESLVEFDTLSNQISEQLRLRFESQEAVLKQTSALFTYRENDVVSSQDFHQFVSATLIGHPTIYGLEWVPKINRQGRASFVKQQKLVFPAFEIKQFNAGNNMIISGEKDYYYPITYVEPVRDTTRAILGFDLSTLPDRAEVLHKAIKLKKAVATPPTHLIINDGKELGLLLMYPVEGKQSGVLSTILRANSFFGDLFTPESEVLNARLVDIKTGRFLYNNFTEAETEPHYSRVFNFGDRQYRLETTPSTQYYQQHKGWHSWNLLAVGIFGTGLMGALLLMGTGYTVRIENLVKQKTEDLKESFTRFQEITSSLGEGIYVQDTNGLITFVNPKAQELLGWSEQELLGNNAHLLFHHKHLDHSTYPECDCKIRHVIHSKQTYKSGEEVFWHKNGNPIYSAVSAVPLFRDNVIVGSVVVFDDISDRKKIEQALRASEKSFKEIIEFAPIGMAIVSLDGRFLIVNQTLCNIVGYSNDELRTLTFQEITYHEDLTIDLEFVQQLLDGKTVTYQMEKRYICKDEKLVWVQLSVSLFRDETNAPQYFIAQIEDITERKVRDTEVTQFAYFDTLTKLPNRRLLKERLTQEISQTKRSMALFFLDLDHFKQINDKLGHDVGDMILKEAALRLSGCVRSHDTVSRLGGDEFVIILTDITDVDDAIIVAEKILRAIKQPIEVNGQQVYVGTSIGIAMRLAGVSVTAKELMKYADTAMYQSKGAGRNRYFLYDDI